jgi:hypothetical protein
MSVEQKIKELLNRSKGGEQLTEESAENLNSGSYGNAGVSAANNAKKDTSKAGVAANAGDTTQPRQGDSKEASIEKLDDMEPGKTAASKASKETPPAMKGDAKSVKTQASEEEELEGEVIAEEEEEQIDLQSQLNAIFGENLSEEFKAKATSIFEAAVIARVNNEMTKVTDRLEEQAAAQLTEHKESLVNKIDGYLNYVVEQWMEENSLAVESGLRTEIAEDFITGLKTLFKEHHIEVPEDKYDVVVEFQDKAETLESKLNESITDNIALTKELTLLKQTKILDENTKDLADTEAEKLKKLVEGIEFETEDLFREKVTVIKENYFPKAAKTSPEQVLVESSGTNTAAFDDNIMNKYVQAISRTVKSR